MEPSEGLKAKQASFRARLEITNEDQVPLQFANHLRNTFDHNTQMAFLTIAQYAIPSPDDVEESIDADTPVLIHSTALGRYAVPLGKLREFVEAMTASFAQYDAELRAESQESQE